MKIVVSLAMASALAVASGAAADPAQEHELRSLGQCALAGKLYQSLMGPGAPITPTEADKALYARLQAVTPVLAQRAEALAMAVGVERGAEIRAKLMAELKAQIEPAGGPRLAPRAALDRYAPTIEACIERGDLLSGAAATPPTP